MNSIIQGLAAFFEGLPMPLLEVWGRLAYVVGLALAISAFGGFTFRPGGRWGLGRERQSWDSKAVLSIPLTFILIILTGYAGSFIVLVPGAQTFESVKDLVVFLCIVLFGYPALIAVPFAYGLSDLIEGVPPEFLLNWLPGYLINPACFWIAYQLFGKNPDFRRARTWGSYVVFVVLFMAIEPVLWGYVCAGEFTSAISYGNITPALFFTTSITWLIAPVAMLIAYPLTRKIGMFWAEIPRHVKERRLGRAEWVWEARAGDTRAEVFAMTEGWPIRVVILAPFIALVLLMVAATAYVTLRSAEVDANKLATRLHEEISDNINLHLDEYLAQHPPDTGISEGMNDMLRRLPVAEHGLALIIDGEGQTVASSIADAVAARHRVAAQAIAGFKELHAGPEQLEAGIQFEFHYVTAKPPSREAWLTRATSYRDRQGGHADWLVLTVLPESYYLAGLQAGNSRSAMIFALALLLSLALAAVLAATVTGNLRRISFATQAMAHGDLSQRVPGSRMEELGTLSQSFNGMAAQLQQSFARLRTSENRLQIALRAGSLAIWDWDVEKDHLVWDDSMYQLYDVRKEDFSGAFEAWSTCLDPGDFSRVNGDVKAALRGEREFASEFRIRLKDGSTRFIRGVAQTVRDNAGKPVRMVGINWDATEQMRRDLLLAEEARILGMIATGATLTEILNGIVLSVQAIAKDTIGSILLLDVDGIHVRHGAGPSLPDTYVRAIEGAAIGPIAGSCGTAMYRREPVIVTDIETDPLWENYRDLARTHGLRACWSTPIFDSRGAILGTFALYYSEPRSPVADDLALIQRATHLAGVAIERRLAEDERSLALDQLRRSEERFQLVARATNDAIWDWDIVRNTLWWNQAVTTLFKYSAEQVDANEVWGYRHIHLDDRERVISGLQQLMDTGSQFWSAEYRFRRADGSFADVLDRAFVIYDARGKPTRMIGAISDITDRKQTEMERNKRQRAEAADRIKSAFLATMSHELRTPLNSIIGFTGIILLGLAGPLNAEQTKQLEMVRTSARHLLALVNDVLDISKIEAGQLQIFREPFDLCRSINKVVSLVTPMAESKGLELCIQLAPGLNEAVSDELRFEQILLNLFSNAIKFTESGKITLIAELVSDFKLPGAVSNQPAICLQVSDTGMGIKPEDLQELFQPFRQVDSGLARQHEGTGLGLFICRRLAGLMGGEIHAQSTWGKGSSFSVTLPLKAEVKS